MKKLFLMAVAAVAMLATSCSKDDTNAVAGGEKSTVTFAVEAPVMATRADLGDGTTATDLSWAVYAEDGTYLPNLGGSQENAFDAELKANVKIDLVNGKKYSVIFWAGAEGAPYKVDFAAKTMEVNTTLTSNKEAYDAFYKYHKINEVAGPRTETIELKRPFAQLNIATADTQKAADGGLVVAQTKVVVPAYNTLNLFSGEVSGDVTNSYAFADLLTGKTIEVGDKNYDLLSMNYILVNEKELETVKFTVKNDDDTFEKEFTYNNVPLQRNHKTNIIGNILTSTYDFTIEINPIFADEYDSDAIEVAEGVLYNIVEKTYTLTSVAGLKWFAKQTDGVTRAEATFDTNGGEFKGYKVVLGADMDLAGEAWTPIASGSKVFRGTFDGNGKTISNLKVVATDKSPVGLFAKSRGLIKNVTVENVDIVGHYKAGAIVGDGLCSHVENCHVDGGSIVITPLNEDDGNHAGGIVGYLSAETTASVKDCSVKNLTVSAYRDVAGLVGTVTGSKAAVVTNGKVENVTVIADQSVAYKEDKAFNAGEIVGRNIKGVDLSSCKATNVTIKNQVNNKALNFALKQNVEYINVELTGNVSLNTQDAYLKLGGEDTKVITIDGNNNNTLTLSTTYWSRFSTVNPDAKVVLKNMNLTSSQETGTWNSYDITINCNVELENVNLLKALAFDGANTVASLKNVTITESHDYYALWISAAGQKVTIDGLTINSDGRGIKIDEQYVDAVAKVTLNINNAKFVTKKKAAILVKSVAGAEINVSNIDITEVNDDSEFAVWVDEDSKAHAAKVVVNGAKVIVEGTVVAEAKTAEDITSAITSANDKPVIVKLAAGNYVVPAAAKGKMVTFVGTEKPEDVKVAVTKVGNGGENCDYGLDGSNATFENITITTNSSTYIGYARCNGTYKNCIINGTYTLYGNSVFEDCTFNVSGDVYNLWTWGAPTATFTRCTFNSDGKALLLYGMVNTKLTVNNCTFNDNGGLTDLKAAIEIGNDYNKSYELFVNETVVNGYEINDKGIVTGTTLWANKNSMPKDKLNVVVDGVDVY